MTLSQHQQIVLASGNAGKIREIQAILKSHPIVPQVKFQVEEAEETGTTFIENAIIKARNASVQCKLPVIADDSGLVVDALGGEPGVISARYAGPSASDQENLEKLLSEMQGIPFDQRSARFVCVIVFMEHALDPCPLIAQGVWEGKILETAKGVNGFGYDPVFWVPEYQCSSAELDPDLKNRLSHRGTALRVLTELMRDR